MSERVHELKTWPTYWDAVARGEKLFEVRENDRFFQAGDIVELIRLTADRIGATYDLDHEVRRSYLHLKCGVVTTMAQTIAETYARDPSFYGGTFCEFVWNGTNEKVGT